MASSMWAPAQMLPRRDSMANFTPSMPRPARCYLATSLVWVQARRDGLMLPQRLMGASCMSPTTVTGRWRHLDLAASDFGRYGKVVAVGFQALDFALARYLVSNFASP